MKSIMKLIPVVALALTSASAFAETKTLTCTGIIKFEDKVTTIPQYQLTATPLKFVLSGEENAEIGTVTLSDIEGKDPLTGVFEVSREKQLMEFKFKHENASIQGTARPIRDADNLRKSIFLEVALTYIDTKTPDTVSGYMTGIVDCGRPN